jgi:anti-sigma regulatory factor (Ser/Thr protein kinase)
MSPRHSFAVRIGRDAPAAVRKALRERDANLPAALRDDLLLLLTEIVTNAVLHSGARDGDPIEVDLRERPGSVHVVVTDPGNGFDRPRNLEPDHSTTGGLGLVLVDRIARAWGTCRGERGSTVWFELGY